PLWIGAVAAFRWGRSERPPPLVLGTPSRQGFVLAGAVLLGFAVVLPITQREQMLRTSVERALREQRFADALEEMSAHELSDFPPYWRPPPALEVGKRSPDVLDVMEVISAS